MSIHELPHEYDMPPPLGRQPLSPGASIVLHGGDVVVAWIARRALGFGGFGDEHEAAAFAWAVHVALSQWTAHEWHAAPPVAVTPHLEISAAADRARWVIADRLPIARLVEPGTVRLDRATADVLDGGAAPTEGEGRREARVEPLVHIGFELPVPLPAGALDLQSAARALCRALSRGDERGVASTATTEHRPVGQVEMGRID